MSKPRLVSCLLFPPVYRATQGHLILLTGFTHSKVLVLCFLNVFYSFLYINYIISLRNEQCTENKPRQSYKNKTQLVSQTDLNEKH
jgi:hypothetical protein